MVEVWDSQKPHKVTGKICICLIKTAWTANEKASVSTTLSNPGTEKTEAQDNNKVLKSWQSSF